MGLSKEEREQLEALQARESEPDDNDFEIEIWDEHGAGAKVPYSKGKTWLQRFGIDLPETPPTEDDETETPKTTARKAGQAGGSHAQRYFGSKRVS